MGSTLGMFDDGTAQVIAAIGVFVFLLLWGTARVIRAIAELVRARNSPPPPASPFMLPPIVGPGSDPPELPGGGVRDAA